MSRGGLRGEVLQALVRSFGGAPAVPADFAARVARRAFAGDTGERTVELTPAGAAAQRETPILQFALRMTAAAAAVLMTISIGIGYFNQPDSDVNVEAFEGPAALEEHEVLDALDKLNRESDESSESEEQ